MLLLIALVVLILVDLAALRFGYDSRQTRSAGLSASWHSD